MTGYVLAIDQGTTSSRALLFDDTFRAVGTGQSAFAQYFPKDGWVEHDPDEIWDSVVNVTRSALDQSGVRAESIAALGVTNQRETMVVWDRKTGTPLNRAIVWQDRRTTSLCASLKKQGHEPLVSSRTGLLLDPYFSATKLAWLFDTVDRLRERAEAGEI